MFDTFANSFNMVQVAVMINNRHLRFYCGTTFTFSVSQFALTHLSELLIDQLQPGHIQIIQVIAAVELGGRRLGVTLLLLPVVGQATC